MSDILVAKLKLKQDFYSIKTSDLFFDIIRTGCEHRIAIQVISVDDEVDFLGNCKLHSDEVLLRFFDSYNFRLVEPLVEYDNAGDVKKYRPKPLSQRLLNLEKLFAYIFQNEDVLQVDLILADNYAVCQDANIIVSESVNDFANILQTYIDGPNQQKHIYQFRWIK